MRRVAPRSLLCVAGICVSVAGCGASASVQIGDPTLDQPEQDVSQALLRAVGQRPKAVSCPDEVPAKNGHHFRCVVTEEGGTRFGATVTESNVHDEHLHLDVQVDEHPLR